MHHGFGVRFPLLDERLSFGKEMQGCGAPFMDRLPGIGGGFRERLLEGFEFLTLFAVGAEKVAREDELPCHGHDHGHEDVAAFDTVGQVGVDVGAVQDGVLHPVDDFLVPDLRGQVAGAGVGEFGEAEDPLLDVAAEGLAEGVEVIFVAREEGVGGWGVVFGSQDLGLEGADLGLRRGEVGLEAVEFEVFGFEGCGDFVADDVFHAGGELGMLLAEVFELAR